MGNKKRYIKKNKEEPVFSNPELLEFKTFIKNILIQTKKEILNLLKDKETKNRILFSIPISLFCLIPIIKGGTLYLLFLFIIAVFSIYEFNKMIENIKNENINIYNKYRKNGIIYIFTCITCLALLRMQNEGLEMTIWLFIVVFTFDSASYFFGRKFGKTLLSPSISPSKTLEGAIFGGFTAIIISSLIYDILTISKLKFEQVNFLAITLLIIISAQIGDLIESWVKRFCKVKDSSLILGKHGGIMDRFDSIILSGSVLYVISFFTRGKLFNL